MISRYAILTGIFTIHRKSIVRTKELQPSLLAKFRNAMVGLSFLVATSCNEGDPGAQTELIQLKAERTQLKEKIQALENELAKKNMELVEAGSKSTGESFDKQSSISRFIETVSSLRKDLESEFPGAILRDSVQMPSFDAPLRGEIQIEVTLPGATARSFHWTGVGKLDGEWTLTTRRELGAAGGGSSSPITTSEPEITTTPVDPKPAESPNGPGGDLPQGSRIIRDDENGAVWMTPDGRYIIKLKNQ